MKKYFTFSETVRKIFAVLTVAVLFIQPVFGALVVSNGNFSDTSGMTAIADGWYNGTPTGWSANGTNEYVIREGILNLDHVGTFSQTLGTVEAGAEMITLAFSYGDFWNDGYYAPGEDMLTVELWDTTANTLLASKTVQNNAAYQTLAGSTVANTTPATVGNTIELRVIGLPGTGPAPDGRAAALDNVTISTEAAPAPVVVLTAPTIVSPVNNSYTTSADIVKVDWTDVVDGTAPITYVYSVSNSDTTNPDGTFTTPLYTSGALTDSEIPTPNTPEGVYYFSVQATDSEGNKSPWTAPTKVTVDNSYVALTAPTITAPSNESYFTTTPITSTWTAVDGAVKYQVWYIYDDGHTFTGGPETCPDVSEGGCRETTDLSRNHSPSPAEKGGVTVRIRAIGASDNLGPWSEPVHYYYVDKVPSTVVVKGNTAAGENMPGWLFNRDTSTSNPYEFVVSTPKIGTGSLYIEPIGATPANKFVGEYFFDTAAVKLADIESISYDFQIGNGGDAADANQFYMNIYANFGVSDPNKYYDCRYNVVPSTGAVGGYTTVNFDPTATYTVAQRNTSPSPCPTSPAAMGAGAIIRAVAINLGDTSVSDVGIDGFFDNVVITTTDAITTYDFEGIERIETTETIVVTPAALNGWAPTGTGGGSYEFIESAGAPSGNGSIQILTNSDNNARAGAYLDKNVPLEDLHELSYKTRQNAASSPAGNGSYRITFDADGDLSTTGDTATLIYEPYWQNGGSPDPDPIIPGVWQTWDVDNGLFWASIPGANQPNLPAITNGAGGPPFYTLDQIRALYPDAETVRVGFGIGSYNPSYDIEIDDFVFSTQTQTDTITATYDFEPIAVPACEAGETTFDTFNLGNVNGQFGWASTGPFDQAIVKNTYGYTSFGCKSLRISNATTSGSFGDQTFSYSLADEAGETEAENNSLSGGTRQNRFEAEFDFASAVPDSQQAGLSVSISPDRGDGARMSWVQVVDTPTGLTVNFNDYNEDDGFVQTTIASDLDRTATHTIKIMMDFIDGPANDIVEVYVDGTLAHTGTSWEDYFRVAEGNPPRTVDSLLFRVSGTAAPAHSGKGFLFDNVVLSSSKAPITGPTLISPADGTTYTTAQLPKPQTWTAVAGATKYVYESYTVDPTIDTDATPFYTQERTSPSRTIGATAAEGTYWWRVKAKTPAGDSEWSNVFTFTVDNTPPADTTAPVISDTASNPSETELVITWTTDEGATSQVEYGPTPTYGSLSPLSSTLVTDHSVILSGLDDNTTYYFRVISTDGEGNTATGSENTGTTSETTPTPAPSGVGGVVLQDAGIGTPTPTQTPAPEENQTPNPEPTTPENNQTPEETPTPDNTEPTPENPVTNPEPISENNQTPEETPTPTPTPNPTTGGGTGGTGGTGGNPLLAFNPADATLDIGGGVEPEETPEETFDPADATLDEGGGVAVDEKSYTLLWILLGLLALLNSWWFLVAKNRKDTTYRS